jgi:hypothetical protein
MNSICLSFMLATSPGSSTPAPIPVPESVATLALQQVRTQYENRHPGTRLTFDDTACPQQGQYEFGAETLRLRAEHRLWPGEREYAVGDLLDGKRMEFPLPDAPPGSPAFTRRGLEGPTPGVSHFLLGAAAGALAGGAGGVLLSPNAESRNLNGLVFGLTGGLVGGLLALAYESF